MFKMKIIKSKIAPNPKEFQYWIDLSADKYGNVMKVWVSGRWQTSSTSGSTGGTSDYRELSNKPKINGVTLMGNVALETLDVQKVSEMSRYAEDSEVASLIPENYITENELSDYSYNKEQVSQMINEIEGTSQWNDVQ